MAANNPFVKDLANFKPGQLGAEMNQLSGVGARIAGQVGLQPGIGQHGADQAMGFGMAMNKAGGMDRFGSALLDQELRLSAAKSPMANAMGAAMAMHEAGIITGDKNAIINQIGQAGPAGFVQVMQNKFKVDPHVASQFLNAQNTNQDQIAKHNLQDTVRQFQGAEVSGVMQEQLAAGLQGGLKAAGLGRQARRQLGAKVASTMEQALRKMAADDPKGFADAGKRATQITAAVAGQLGAAGVDSKKMKGLVAGAIHGLDESMRRDTSFNSLQEALLANDPELMRKGGEAAKEIDERVKKEGVPPPAPEGGKDGGAGPQPGGKPGKGGGRQVKISGTITINEDGSMKIDANEGGDGAPRP